jgi:hypothetical protein
MLFFQHTSLSDGLRSKAQLSQTRRRERERRVALSHSVTNTFPDLNVVGLPLARHPYTEPVHTLSFGQMNATCSHCGAFHWLIERIKNSPVSAPRFSRCCHHGKVRPGILPQPPE